MAEESKSAGNIPENAPEEETPKEASSKKKPRAHRKLPIILGAVVAVVIVAGAGFWVWHEQPSFCNAICHTPMDAYLPTYECEMNEPGIDKWGNEVSTSNAMLAPVHRVENENTCMSCHVPVLSEQVSEVVSWVSGNYDVVTTQTGMKVIPECNLEDLTAARGIAPNDFCLNSSCHNLTQEDLLEATEQYGERNPHKEPHGQRLCSDCHKAHRASENYCSDCHNDAPIPDGWLTVAQSKALKKGLS